MCAEKEQRILRRRFLRLSEALGPSWSQRSEDLVRYFVKHIGCRLADLGFEVRPELCAFLEGEGPLRCLAFQLEIRTDLVAMTRHFVKRDGHFPSLWLGDVMAAVDRKTGTVNEVSSFLGYRWLRVSWFYDETIPGVEPPFPPTSSSSVPATTSAPSCSAWLSPPSAGRGSPSSSQGHKRPIGPVGFGRVPTDGRGRGRVPHGPELHGGGAALGRRPGPLNAVRVKSALYERGASVDEAERLIDQALEQVGGWRETEVRPPLEETSPTTPTPEVVELFLVPAGAMRR